MDRARRHSAKSKVAKAILKQFSVRYPSTTELFDWKSKIEVVEEGSSRLFFVNNHPLILQVEEEVYPTLIFKEVLECLPRLTVDMGAIPHVCQGADVMAPGVRGIVGTFKIGDVVTVVDEAHGKIVALGRALVDSQEISSMHRGKIAKNVHFVGDDIWKLIRES